jgi:hypothetical protein
MQKHSRFGWKLAGSVLVLAVAMLGARAAFSSKPADAPPKAAAATAQPQAQAPAGCCDTTRSFEEAHALISRAIDAKRWTVKDHQNLAPIFHSLRTEQKIELIRKMAGAVDAHKITIEKGAHLF